MGHVRKNQSPRIVCDQAAAQELFLHKEQTQVFLDFEVGDKSSVELLGDLKDSAKLFCDFDHKILRQVLLKAKAGWFGDKRTWGSWNNLLFPEYNFVTPPMPVRKIPDWDEL